MFYEMPGMDKIKIFAVFRQKAQNLSFNKLVVRGDSNI